MSVPTSEILESRARNKLRYYALPPSVYEYFAQQVHVSRGYPRGEGTSAKTMTGLAPAASLWAANDGSGRVLTALLESRFTEADDAMLSPALEAGQILELTRDGYESLRG